MGNLNSIDLSTYPKILENVQIAEIQDRQEYIIWLKLSKSETAAALAELSQLCKASISTSLSGRKRGKLALNYYKTAVGAKVHPFAAAQARDELGLTSSRMQELLKMQLTQLSTES